MGSPHDHWSKLALDMAPDWHPTARAALAANLRAEHVRRIKAGRAAALELRASRDRLENGP